MTCAGGLDETAALLVVFGALAGAGLLFATAYWGFNQVLTVVARLLIFGLPAALVIYLLERHHVPQAHLIGIPLLGIAWAMFAGSSVRSSSVKDHLVTLFLSAVVIAGLTLLEALRLQRYEWPAVIAMLVALFIIMRFYQRSRAFEQFKKEKRPLDGRSL